MTPVHRDARVAGAICQMHQMERDFYGRCPVCVLQYARQTPLEQLASLLDALDEIRSPFDDEAPPRVH